MLIQEALTQAYNQLGRVGIDSPQLDAELLLAHTLQTNRTGILAWPERRLLPEQVADYRDSLARRSEREPLAYIIGSREFFGLDFCVDQRVLIPRPETELLVEHALRLARRKPAGIKIADVGTGSGAIAISLARELPESVVYALDSSADSVAVAAENARRHDVADRVQCLVGDLLAPLAGPVDLITANLPYVTTEEWTGLLPELHDYEPRLAFDGGQDGLDLIHRFLDTVAGHLLPRGFCLLEIGPSQGDAIALMAREAMPQSNVQIHQDYAGLDRIVIVEV
jgi:release factor glutamine methyltransferase